MSIALESNGIQRSGSHKVSCIAIYDSHESGRFSTADGRFEATKNLVEDRHDAVVESSSSSSSIGRNSDVSLDGDPNSGDGEEVQSEFKGPLDSLDALEEVLPIKRGISKFYCGKSKSFTSLADAASCSTIKDITKPVNAYSRKRKDLLAYSNFWDKNRNHLSRSNTGGISKRPLNSSRSTLALAVTMSSSESINNGESSDSNSSSPNLCLPPLPPHCRRSPDKESSSSPLTQNLYPWRSFSLSDLQCAATATSSITGLVINSRVKEDKLN
ncbi:unnamed protein product [Ilex paraguariensis]|uniref:Uncharacterized protein n=1 Tax=Ilex paraguariensis TaxID=185542 RepID=A0ABC8RGV3_9AQUA